MKYASINLVVVLTLLIFLPITATPVYAGAKDVTVVNDASNPIPVAQPVDVNVINQPAFQPWRAWFDLNLVEGETSGMIQFPDIPTGKRLVIESVTAQLLVMSVQIPYISLNTDGVWYNVSLTNVGSYAPLQNVWMATHALKLYAEEYGYVSRSRAGGTAGPFFATVSLSGYLVDLP